MMRSKENGFYLDKDTFIHFIIFASGRRVIYKVVTKGNGDVRYKMLLNEYYSLTKLKYLLLK